MKDFILKEHIGVAFVRPSGMRMELNVIEWSNTKKDVIDMRDWSENHEHYARGLTLSRDEMERLVEAYENKVEKPGFKTEHVKDNAVITVGNEPFTVSINKFLDTLSEQDNGWAKKFMVTTWPSGIAKFDIRHWSPDCERMTRGLTFTDSEMASIISVYKSKYPTEGGAQA